MGDIWDTDKLALFLAFFIPGFIMSQIYGLFVATDDSDITKRIPTVVGFSALHYAITGWVVLVTPAGTPRAVAAYVVVLVIPILWPPVILLIRDYSRWRKVFSLRNPGKILKASLTPEASPWDRVLDSTARYIRIRLKSGRFVGGYFANGSTVSAFPCDRQIFISAAYSFDENGIFGQPLPQTGILVQGDEIETLETIELDEAGKSELVLDEEA